MRALARCDWTDDEIDERVFRYHQCIRSGIIGAQEGRDELDESDNPSRGQPELLSWARERAGYGPDALAHRFPKLAAWEQGTAQPTLKQIEKFASATSIRSVRRPRPRD